MTSARQTASLNGVLTDPKKFNIPVTPKEMATAAKEAYDAGASVVHIHFRDQRPGHGHLPTWEPEVRRACRGGLDDMLTWHYSRREGGRVGLGLKEAGGRGEGMPVLSLQF